MAGVRKALIVATDQYTDPKLTRLNAPAEDARALAEVLRDPDVGAYDVQTVLNKTCQEVEIAIASFFQSGARDDTLLVHFSCHGVKDLSGELYFATTDTKLPLLKVTGVSSSMVKQAMEESRASLILCLVDCCYSGAFTKSTKAAATVDLTERLGGRGRAVITASTSLQLALDGQHQASLFTHAVVEGLQSGEADRDLDGLVTLDEFYNYIHEKVTETNPDQTPVKSFDVQGEVYVARRGAPISTPAPLPRELVDTLATGEDWQRLGAVSRLADLLNAGHPGRALGARLALEKVRENDDSIKVRKMAEAALEGAGDTEAIPLIPDYVERVPAERTSDSAEFATAGSKGGSVTAEEPVVDKPVDVKPVVDVPVDVKPVVDVPVPVPVSPVPLPPVRVPMARWKKIVVGGFAAMGAILMALIVIGLLVGDDDGGGNDGGNNADPTETTPPTLPESVLVIPVREDGVRVLKAVDVDSPTDRVNLVSNADLPTVSADRGYMTYLQEISSGGLKNRVAFASWVDGSNDGMVFHDNAQRKCPTSSRLAGSPDGVFVAFTCRKGSTDGKAGVPLGLWHAIGDEDGVDGDEMNRIFDDPNITEAPTWTGGNDIIYVLKNTEPYGMSILVQTPTSGDDEFALTDGQHGWDSHPDWSEGGVLFLRSLDEGSPGDAYSVVEGHEPIQLTDTGDVMDPTWSPDGSRFAFLRWEGPGIRSLWVQDNDPGAEPVPLGLTGALGPPSWGPR